MNERTSNPGGAAGHGVHGFVHGKLCEVEHENVGTEGAHRSELVGEAVGGKMVRFTQKRVRTRPARAAARSESQFIKAQADYQTRKLAQEQPEAFKSAAARLWHREKLKRQYRKQAREAACCALEAKLQNYLDTYTSTHSYDEYHFNLDDIGHDPYVLTSILSALHEGGWSWPPPGTTAHRR